MKSYILADITQFSVLIKEIIIKYVGMVFIILS